MMVASHTRIGSATERLWYFDALRAIAILAVVTIHAAITEWHQAPVESWRWDVLNWINSLPRFCVPVFLMISGALFLDPSREVTWRALWRKYLPRVAAAFAAWSLFFALVNVYGPGGSGSFPELVTRFFTGHFHLWFLLALMGLYLLVPILRPIVRDRRVAWYFVGLALPFAYVFPMLERVPAIGDVLGSMLGAAKLELVLGYSSYFVLGYLLSRVRLQPWQLWALAGAGAAGLAATAVGTAAVSRRAGEWDELFYGFLTPNVLAVSVAVFCLVKAAGDLGDPARKPSRIVGFLSNYSFGIYLVHPFFQWVYRQFGLTTEFAHPLISVPALTLLVLIPSAVTAVLISRIPRVGRFLG